MTALASVVRREIAEVFRDEWGRRHFWAVPGPGGVAERGRLRNRFRFLASLLRSLGAMCEPRGSALEKKSGDRRFENVRAAAQPGCGERSEQPGVLLHAGPALDSPGGGRMSSPQTAGLRGGGSPVPKRSFSGEAGRI